MIVVGLMPTYREGPLAIAGVRSLLRCCSIVYVYEGPITGAPETGDPTDFAPIKRDNRVTVKHGTWESEEAKRNAMLTATRRYPAPTWGVFLDADEILMDAEYVPDLIYAAQAQKDASQSAASIPLLIQEVDYSVGKVHRIFRLDLLEAHILSMSQWQFKGQDFVVTLPLTPVWRPGEPITETNRPPMKGEPSIHHRAYYRHKDRTDYRLHKSEGESFAALERAHLERLGIVPDAPGKIPVPQEAPKLIVASEREVERAAPSGLLEYAELDDDDLGGKIMRGEL